MNIFTPNKVVGLLDIIFACGCVLITIVSGALELAVDLTIFVLFGEILEFFFDKHLSHTDRNTSSIRGLVFYLQSETALPFNYFIYIHCSMLSARKRINLHRAALLKVW